MRPSRRYQLLNGRGYYDAERYHLRAPSAALADRTSGGHFRGSQTTLESLGAQKLDGEV
jgi:hypothetical protein